MEMRQVGQEVRVGCHAERGAGVIGRKKYQNPQMLRPLTVSPPYPRIPHPRLQPPVDAEPGDVKG